MSIRSQSEYSAILQSAARKLSKAPAGRQQLELARLVARLQARLARPPRILLLGEINSGKSSLANLLIGESVVPTSVIANTRFPIRFHHSDKPILSALLRDGRRENLVWSQIQSLVELPVERIDIGLSIERLKVFEVIDMPGTGNPVQDVSRFERQRSLAQLPIWCTVATRAWKESERKEWSRLPEVRKARGILVVTQTDLLPDRNDLDKVLERLRRETAGHFRAIVPLASLDAFASSMVSSTSDKSDLWVESGGEKFEMEITKSLSDLAAQRVKLARRALCLAFTRRGVLTGNGDAMPDAHQQVGLGADHDRSAMLSQLGAEALGDLIPAQIARSPNGSSLLTTTFQADQNTSASSSTRDDESNDVGKRRESIAERSV